MKIILVSIYIDPEFYPPTKSAIFESANVYDKVIVLTRNFYKQAKNDYPGNVTFVKSGKFQTVQESESRSLVEKMFSFLIFWVKYQKLLIFNTIDVSLIYDPIPLFAFFISWKKGNTRFWYHNHDMPDIKLTRKLSIGWFSAKFEKLAMKRVNYFSLPSRDRLIYYYNWTCMQSFIYLPNFPRKNLFLEFKSKSRFNRFTIIFQGAIGAGHALEDLIQLLPNMPEVDLILKGPVRDEYKNKLNSLIESKNVIKQVKWIGITSYAELIQLTVKCHLGIAVYQGRDDVSKTLGTASNKIYEYLASGLPVVLHDNDQFKKSLGLKPWFFYYNGDLIQLENFIRHAQIHFNELSVKAVCDYEENYCFEPFFSRAISLIRV